MNFDGPAVVVVPGPAVVVVPTVGPPVGVESRQRIAMPFPAAGLVPVFQSKYVHEYAAVISCTQLELPLLKPLALPPPTLDH